jgi:hypothetical protein
MYPLGHSDAKFTMRVYQQQVLDMGGPVRRVLERVLGSTAEEAFAPSRLAPAHHATSGTSRASCLQKREDERRCRRANRSRMS